MAKTVNVHEAKTHFSKLLQEVEAGEDIVVARAGKPVAKLIPVSSEPAGRTLGVGLRYIKDFDWETWDELDKEVGALFRGLD